MSSDHVLQFLKVFGFQIVDEGLTGNRPYTESVFRSSTNAFCKPGLSARRLLCNFYFLARWWDLGGTVTITVQATGQAFLYPSVCRKKMKPWDCKACLASHTAASEQERHLNSEPQTSWTLPLNTTWLLEWKNTRQLDENKRFIPNNEGQMTSRDKEKPPQRWMMWVKILKRPSEEEKIVYFSWMKM